MLKCFRILLRQDWEGLYVLKIWFNYFFPSFIESHESWGMHSQGQHLLNTTLLKIYWNCFPAICCSTRCVVDKLVTVVSGPHSGALGRGSVFAHSACGSPWNPSPLEHSHSCPATTLHNRKQTWGFRHCAESKRAFTGDRKPQGTAGGSSITKAMSCKYHLKLLLLFLL